MAITTNTFAPQTTFNKSYASQQYVSVFLSLLRLSEDRDNIA